MGATVTTGRRVAAFRAQDGRIIYVLYEETYEKNCSPHTPSWCVVGIGEIQDVLKRIFSYGSICEGGLLQNRGGHMTPEGYIRTWLQELAHPLVQPDVTTVMTLGPYMSDPMDKEKIDEIRARAESIGKASWLNAIAAGEKPTLSLQGNTDTVLAFFGVGGVLPAWRLLRHGWPPDGARDSGLGYAPNPAPPSALPDPVVLRVGATKSSGDPCLIRNEDSSYTESGWSYSVIGEFVKGLWKDELQYPGHYYSRIRKFRERIKSLTPVSFTDLKVVVDTQLPFTGQYAEYEERKVSEFRTKYPVMDTVTGFEFSPTNDNFHDATCLDRDRTRWIYRSSPGLSGFQSAVPAQDELFGSVSA